MPQDIFFVIGDKFGLEKTVMSHTVHRFIELLGEKKDSYIRFPSSREHDEVKTGFYKNAGFPNVAGCIDGTHPHQGPIRGGARICQQEGLRLNQCSGGQ